MSQKKNYTHKDWLIFDKNRPLLPAAAYCSVCMFPFHGSKFLIRKDGRAICSLCTQKENINPVDIFQKNAVDPVLAYGWKNAITNIIFRAHETLITPFVGSIVPALRFGYVMTMLGIGMWLAWILLLHKEPFLDTMFEAMEASQGEFPTDNPEKAAITGMWIIVPFIAALRLSFGGLAFHFGVRLAGAPEHSFKTHIRLFALTSASLLFCIIPEFGTMIAMIVWLSSSLAFLRQHYQFGTLRGLASTTPALLIISNMWPIIGPLY